MNTILRDESARLKDLASYYILDTPPEQEFDDIARLAALVCGVPIALISLVDANRQWFKARIGLEFEGTSREIAICAHVVLQEELLEVEDLRGDERFRENPLVTDGPKVCFYAGVPLISENGMVLGALCVMDHVPRRLMESQRVALRALARQSVKQMQFRKTIHELKEVQQRIALSEEQLSLAVDAAGIGFWDWNMRENTVTMSPLHEQLLGLPVTGLPRPVAHFFERLHPEDIGRISNLVNQAIAERCRYLTEMRVVWPDGTVHWMLDAGSAQYDENGAPYRMNGTMADISDRKRTERELELRQERFDLAVSASNTGVWDWSAASNEWYNSDISRDILGDTDSDPPWTLDTWWERMHPEDLLTVRPFVEAQMADPQVFTWRVEHRALHRDGDWRWLLVQARVARDQNGRVLRMTGTHIDLTEQKQRERVLAEAKATADQANRAKSDFLANISHEIRTPMHGIIGLTRLLSNSPLNKEQQTYLQGIDTSAQSLLRLVNEVLDFSKVEAGKMTLETESFDVARMFEDILQQMDVSANAKGLLLVVEVEPALRVCLQGDAGRLRQVLINLVSNAIKFTDKGFVRVRARRMRQEGGRVRMRVDVMDSGIGIADESLPLLFKPFSQLDASRSRRFSGTGLGLSICKRIMDLMGGSISVESHLGRGSNFWIEVELPLAAQSTEVLRPSVGPESVKLSGLVLVVEDNEINQMILLSRLAAMGLETHVAFNGLEAVNAVHANLYNIILMDCQMPTMDGYEASRMIRSSASDQVARIPIVAMTANAMPGERERCLQAGMSDYITKPIDERILVNTLRDWLGRKVHGSPFHERTDMPMLDIFAFDRLGGHRTREGRTLISNLISKFQQTSPVLVQSIQEGIIMRDWALVRRSAHTLKSSFAYLGGVRSEQACHELELASMQGAMEPQAATRMLENIRSLNQSFLVEILKWQERTMGGDRV